MLFEDDSGSRAGACSENNFSASLFKSVDSSLRSE